jgi:pimeloyl-ACP methyl ester carboxylesterase
MPALPANAPSGALALVDSPQRWTFTRALARARQPRHKVAGVMTWDEFSLLPDNAEEAGLPWSGPPAVRRTSVDVDDGRMLSALVWGTAHPELVLIHGGAQNAHTWDTVALALGRPLVAIDLPGHGYSSWRDDATYDPVTNSAAVATAIAALAPQAHAVVGMSLGGLTAIALTARHPELVARLCLVDVTPGVNAEKGATIAAFVRGPESFESFDEILQRTMAFNPTRSEASLRRGILHNAVELDDGRWAWRHHFSRGISEGREGAIPWDNEALWEDLSAVKVPLMLVRGSLSPVVDDADVAEVQRRQPTARVEVVEGSGHSVQGDRPLVLAGLIADFAP